MTNVGPEFASKPVPWPEPVLGEQLLDEIVHELRRFIVAGEADYVGMALWVIFAHAHDCFDNSPILAVSAPTMRSGKTTTLHVLGQMVPCPIPTSSLTQAIFRAIEAWHPTLIADEGDTYLKENKALRGVLNSGFDRSSASIVRNTGDNYEPKVFSTWCPKIIAFIGSVNDTLKDRSIEIRLRRKSQHEQVERLSIHRLGKLTEIPKKVARWVNDNLEALKGAEPAIPAGLRDRNADKFRPLIAIADAAGGHWAGRARAAAVELAGDPLDQLSTAELLITDLGHIAKQLTSDFIGTYDLTVRLKGLEHGRWKTQSDTTFSTFIALTLKPFRVSPIQKKLEGNKVQRGYRRDVLLDLADRYGVRPVPDTRGESPGVPSMAEAQKYREGLASSTGSGRNAPASGADGSAGSGRNNVNVIAAHFSGGGVVDEGGEDPPLLALMLRPTVERTEWPANRT